MNADLFDNAHSAEARALCQVNGCSDFVYIRKRGWCSKHYQRWQRTGNPEGFRTENGEPLRFLVDALRSPPGQCVDWPHCKTEGGYGIVRYKGKNWTTNRLILCMYTGFWPNISDFDAAHGPCHNRSCINPHHLSWKTRADNFADKVRDGTDNRGENSPLSKLTTAQALAIRESQGSKVCIAESYGVSEATVRDIKAGRSWKHLQ